MKRQKRMLYAGIGLLALCAIVGLIWVAAHQHYKNEAATFSVGHAAEALMESTGMSYTPSSYDSDPTFNTTAWAAVTIVIGVLGLGCLAVYEIGMIARPPSA